MTKAIGMAYECEAKLRVDSLDSLSQRLSALGAVDEGGGFERNWVLDHADASLRSNGILLRVRSHGGPSGILTVKGPVEHGEFKTREEVETMVDNALTLIRQMEMLGFTVHSIYEKHRHSWRWRDCVIALDRCPELGCFAEIEGEPDHICLVAADLGLDPKKHIDDSYLGLWAKHLEALGQPKRDMIFNDTDRFTQFCID